MSVGMHATAQPTASVPAVVRRLCDAVAELETLFGGRKFTLDGHLVGSIGEVLAAEQYGLTLLSMTEATHDARTLDGRLVQIKTTQGRTVGLRSQPDQLLVVKLTERGTIEEVYNGPGAAAWNAAGRMQKNGARSIGLTKLRSLMTAVPRAERLGHRS